MPAQYHSHCGVEIDKLGIANSATSYFLLDGWVSCLCMVISNHKYRNL